MMLLCTNLGNLWVTWVHQIYKYTFPKRKYSIYNSKNPPKYHPVDMFCHKKYMVRFMVRTILNSPNPELNLRFGSGILVNCELNLWFGSGWFRFEPKFRTELFHHYLYLQNSYFYIDVMPCQMTLMVQGVTAAHTRRRTFSLKLLTLVFCGMTSGFGMTLWFVSICFNRHSSLITDST
jgi:hypothetical protein